MPDIITKLEKKMMFIVNPVAGKKVMEKKLAEVLTVFTKGGYKVTVFPTMEKGDATRYVKAYGKDYDIICCSGGDGTLNETITGVIDADLKPKVGYIPCGSTNDFAEYHGLSMDILEAAKNIVAGEIKAIDIGAIGDKYFINSAEFGAFTWQAYTTSQSLKNYLGGKAYLLGALMDLNRLRSNHLKIEMDGEEFEGDFIFGVTASSCNIAEKILKSFRQPVVADDGLFEIGFVMRPNSVPALNKLYRALKNNDPNTKFIKFCRCSGTTITTDEPFDWNVDGELQTMEGTFEIKILHRRINLMC